jgi:hypothetical protein
MVKADEAAAKVDLIRAQTMKALADAGVAIDNQALDEFKSLKDIEFRERDQSMQAAGMVADQSSRAAESARADRGEMRADRQQDFAEQSGERQHELAERAQSASERGAV